MGFKINVDRFGFAKEPKPEKNSRDYAAELAKSLIDKEEAERMNEDAVLLGKITAEESARATAIEQLREEVVNRNNAIDSAIDQEARVRELKDNALEELIDEKVTGEVAARNEAISEAIAKEVTARNQAINYAQSVEEGTRHLEDKKLEAAIRAEQSARELLSGEVSDKVSKKGGYGLSRITGGSVHNTLFVEVIKEDGTTDNTDVQLPGTTLAEYGITNAYTKSEVDAKIAASGSGNLSNYYTKEEINYFNREINSAINAKADLPWVHSSFAGIDMEIETLDNKIGDIDSALDAIIALQVAKGGDSE